MESTIESVLSELWERLSGDKAGGDFETAKRTYEATKTSTHLDLMVSAFEEGVRWGLGSSNCDDCEGGYL